MIDCRKHEPNIAIQLPDWEEVSTDVLALPIQIRSHGDEGFYWTREDGEFGAAVADYNDLYHGHCTPAKYTIIQKDGSREEYDTVTLDHDMLVRRIYGQAFDPELRAAFAKCLQLMGANPDELIPLGERVFAEYAQEAADKMIAEGQAMAKVDDLYGDMLPKYLAGEVLQDYRTLLMRMTLHLGKLPELLGIMGTENRIYLAVKDIEAMTGRKFPAGAWLPDYVYKSSGRRYLSLPALMVFSLGPLKLMWWDNEEHEGISTLHACCCGLQYHLLDSTPEGRQVLDRMAGGLFGGAIESDPE